MNSDQMAGKWKQIKGSVKTHWGKLTDDDLDAINGQTELLVGRIQERYGIAKAEAQRQVDDWSLAHSTREEEYQTDRELKRKAS